MAYTSIYKYGIKTKAQMIALTEMSIGDNCFVSDWNTEAIYNGQFWLASNMIVLANGSGNVVEGEVLVASSTVNNTVTRSTTTDNTLVIGTVVYAALSGANVVLQTRGVAKCRANTIILNGAFIYTTSGNGYSYDSAIAAIGCFGISSQAVTGGTALFDAVITNRREFF